MSIISPKELFRLSGILASIQTEYATGTDDFALGYRLGSLEAFKDSITQSKTPSPKDYPDSTITTRGYYHGWKDFKNEVDLIICE